ncbi:MAG: WG repeat-containing protein [Marinilabiliaceae bacterium]|nr:WG repeat-containing protein [Marinilabiliaceae bacterium]
MGNNNEKIEPLVRISKNKYGFEDENKNEIVPPVYTDITEFGNGYAVVVDHETKYRKFIDATGKTIFELECEVASIPYQGRTICRKNDKWGIVDIFTGKTILQCEYDDINCCCKDDMRYDAHFCYLPNNYPEPFEENELSASEIIILQVAKDKKWGIVEHLHGKILLPLEYDEIILSDERCSDDKGIVLRVNKGGKWGMQVLTFTTSSTQNDHFDTKIKTVLPCEYDDIQKIYSSEDLFWSVKKDNKWGIIDLEGTITIPVQYDEIDDFRIASHGFLKVKKEGKWGVLNFNGNPLTSCEYDNIKFEYDKEEEKVVFSVKKDKKWDLIVIDYKTI